MNVCRFGYKRSDGKCALNGKKCRTTCGSNVDIDVEPPTHKDVLLKRWVQDTEAMAKTMIYPARMSGWYTVGLNDETRNLAKTYSEALADQIAYLNSAAEAEV